MLVWDSDPQFFAEIVEAWKLTHRCNTSQGLVTMLNLRAAQRLFDCIHPECEMPLWCEHVEIINDKQRLTLLAQYRCGRHEDIYEAIRLW